MSAKLYSLEVDHKMELGKARRNWQEIMKLVSRKDENGRGQATTLLEVKPSGRIGEGDIE